MNTRKTAREFEDWLVKLPKDQYDILLQERILRLDAEQKAIVLKREELKAVQLKMIEKLASPDATEEDHERLYNSLRDMSGNNCEHDRPYCKPCIACGEIEHTMFPELFDEYGLRIEDE